MRFIQEFKLFLKIIFDDKLSDLLFIIILSSYFTIFLVGLILSLYTIILSEIISGLLILFSVFIYYRPFSFERKEYIDYFPSFDIIYVLIIGISIFIHGFITICKKIKKVEYLYPGEITLLIDSQEKSIQSNEPVYIFSCNKKGFKKLFFFYIKNYLEKTTKNLVKILDFDENNFDLLFEYSNSFKIKIYYMKIRVKGHNILNDVTIKNFIGRITLYNSEIKFSIIEKGDISNQSSTIKNILLSIGLLFYDEKNGVKNLNEKMNNFIKKGYTKEYDGFKFEINFNIFSLSNEMLNINFNLNIS